jgi:flagellar motor switch protein FliN/FliY
MQPDEKQPTSDTPAGLPPETAPPEVPAVEVASAAFPDVGREQLDGDGFTPPPDLGVLHDVELDVTVEFGRRQLPLADVLRLGAGSVIELEKMVGEPLAIYANGRLIAEGEAVVVDEQFGVRITRLVTSKPSGNAFH